ncbi:hypothetical protein ACQ4PT_053987 [Festuca glaucescens]
MATPQRRRPPPSLPDHLLELILARLPPEDPSCLLRASLVCKGWRNLIYASTFFLHLLDLGRAPQMLGFLHDSDFVSRLEYVRTSPLSFSFLLPDRDCWYLLGYRHGRALFHSTGTDDNLSLLLWVPFTGQRTEVAVPAAFNTERTYATVICAADGCHHRACHEGPFSIVLVFTDPEEEDVDRRYFTSACVYSSETRTWGKVVSASGVCLICDTPAVLVGKSLLYFLSNCGRIVEYDLARHSLAWIKPPYHDPNAALYKRMILVQVGDAGLGVVLVQPDPDTHGFSDGSDCLCIWSRKSNQGGHAEWVQLGVIYLEDSISHVVSTTSADITAFLIGFAEGANTVFLSTREDDAIFTVELQSKQARKVSQCTWNIDRLAPVLTSYTSASTLQAPQGEHRSLTAFSSSDDEEEEWDEDQGRLLFGNGLDAIERGRFVAAVDYLRNALELRVARYGELSPECASTYYQYGRALLKRAQKAASIVPKSPLYEKTVEGTTSGSDTGNSENSDSKEGQNSNRKYQEDRNGGGDKDDIKAACNAIDSDLDLASYMLEVARGIVEESKVNTVEIFRILSALTEVFTEKRKR